MINHKTNMSSYIRGIFSEMDARAQRREAVKGPDGRPLPSEFAQRCAAQKQHEAREALYNRIAISLSARRLG